MTEESFNHLAEALRNNGIIVHGVDDVDLSRIGLDSLRRRLEEALRTDNPKCSLASNWIPEPYAYFLYDGSRFGITEARELAERMLQEIQAGQ